MSLEVGTRIMMLSVCSVSEAVHVGFFFEEARASSMRFSITTWYYMGIQGCRRPVPKQKAVIPKGSRYLLVKELGPKIQNRYGLEARIP